MENEMHGAILQRDKKTYAIVPRTPAGLITPEMLEKIAKAARDFNIPLIKITSGQRLTMVGLKQEEISPAWNALQIGIGRATELCLHYVQACPGNQVCRFGTQDSLGLGIRLEEFYVGVDLPAKVKIGVSGCPFCCAESLMRDVGLIGKKSGWTVTFGGNAGGRPRIADILAEKLDTEKAVTLIHQCLDYYREQGRKKERTARFVERVGIDNIKKAVGIKAEG